MALTVEELEAKELEIAKKEQELAQKEKDLLALSEMPDKDKIEKLVQERLETSIKDIKSKLDASYSKRDEALKRVAEYEQKEKEAEMARLKEEGKFKEAYEMQLAEEKAKNDALQKRNVELTRDIELKSELSSLVFKNERASKIAFNEIVGELVQNEAGLWVHKSGVSVKEYLNTFSKNEDNAFLFKQTSSSGAGSGGSGRAGDGGSGGKKSLFSMTQAEVLQGVREGRIKRQGR